MSISQNSLTKYLCAYVDVIFDDITHVYTKGSDWRRDKTRLRHEIRSHGSHVLTIMLPEAGKHFDQCLDLGVYLPRSGYLSHCKRGEKVPVFLRDLLIQVFDPLTGLLKDNPSIECITHLRQLYLGGKKILLPCTKVRVRDAVVDFVSIERILAKPTLDWGSDAPLSIDALASPQSRSRIHMCDLDRDRVDSRIPGLEPEVDQPIRLLHFWYQVCQRVFDAVSSGMGDLYKEDAHELPKHGPGVVADLDRRTNKYACQDWPSKLEHVFPQDRYFYHDYGMGDLESVERMRNREVPSRLISVPKTQKSPRLIAAEPSAHQWCQQLLRKQLESRSQRTLIRRCVDFSSQIPNQHAAIQGSMDGLTATVDLSSASDRLSCWVVERFARSNHSLLDRLHAVRTRWTRNGVYPRAGEYHLLRKYATMGSAVVFPLQTIIYACFATAAVAAVEEQERQLAKGLDLSSSNLLTSRRFSSCIDRASRRVQVYGDDIVIPKAALSLFVDALTMVGLKVNTDKTFSGNNFRESCGVDAFRGHDVSPSYLRQAYAKAHAKDFGSISEVSNNLWRSGYWKTANWLSSYLDDWRHLIPIIGPKVDQPGLFSFVGSSINHLKERWNVELQRMEVRRLIPVGKSRRTPGTARQNLMQWFIEKPRPDLPWKAGWDSAKVVITRPGWQCTSFFND